MSWLPVYTSITYRGLVFDVLLVCLDYQTLVYIYRILTDLDLANHNLRKRVRKLVEQDVKEAVSEQLACPVLGPKNLLTICSSTNNYHRNMLSIYENRVYCLSELLNPNWFLY